MGDRLRRAEAASRLGVTRAGVIYLQGRGKVREYRDEGGQAYYDSDEIAALLASGWRPTHKVKAKPELALERQITKGAKIAKAIEMILDGRDRLSIIIELRILPQWVDEAWEEAQRTFESAAEARKLERVERENREQFREDEKSRRAVDRALLKRIKEKP